MTGVKSFYVFGEKIDVIVDSNSSQGASTVITQTSPPGGGPPPHSHTYEDETFTVLTGEFQIFDGANWRPLRQGEVHFAPRRSVHTFRNTAAIESTMLVFIAPGGFENYLEQLSPLSPVNDKQRIIELSQQFGVTFVQNAT